mgnify:CR=1 FL=1
MILKYLILFFSICFSQVAVESTPKSFSMDEEIFIPIERLSKFDVNEFIQQDEEDMRSSNTKPYRFANSISTNLNMQNSGRWTTLQDGSSIWQLKVESEGAFSLNAIYDIFNIPLGAEFFVYSEDKEMVLGAFTSNNHKPHGGFSTAPIKGDKIIFEYNEPNNSSFNGQIQISSIAHDYRNVFFNDERGYGDSGSCNNNTACSVGDEWRDEIRSVAMILTSGGSRLCTGALVNNTAQDLEPYFLTANHCLGGNNSWIFMFNYESPSCTNQNGPTNMTVSGSTLLANSSSSDFALLRLNENPPENYNVHYAGWDISGNTPNTPVGIHHPSGDIKKISFDYNNASNAGNYWDVNQWEDGTTEPGSSGSPLFDGNSQRIIGQLYGGTASCTSITYDTYGKTSVSWNLGMSQYLDPFSTGQNYVDGIDAIDLPDPDLSLIIPDLNFSLSDGETELTSIEISNTGEPESILSYSLKISEFQNPMGGPDLSENYWTDSNNEPNSNYQWIDISDNATLYNFPSNDDAGELINIGFDFPFYNQIFNECFINPNGWIGFSDDSNTWDNLAISSNNTPRNAIFGFWDDLNPVNDNCSSCSGEVYYQSDSDRMVVWFNNVAHWPTYFENSIYNFQMVIYANGEIQFNYQSMSGVTNSASIGVKGESESSSLQMTFNEEYIQNNLSTYISKAPSWIGINNINTLELNGEVEQGNSVQFNIITQNNNLNYGLYDAFLNISTNASNPQSYLIELFSDVNSLSGDLNSDEVLNVLDVIVMVNVILGSEMQSNLSDMNGDGITNVLDVIVLVNIILQD